MANKIMKTLTIGSNTYEIVDEQARTDLSKLAPVSTTGNYDDLTNKPNLADVAISGNYNDLTNKPNLSTVATSGNYNDLSDKPTVDEDITPTSNNPVTSSAIYNALNQKSDKMKVYTATFPVAGWVGDTAPYTQTVTVEGLSASHNPMADISLSDDDTAESVNLKFAAWSLINRLVTGDNTLTAYCYGDAPETEIAVRLAVM
jgi:hypothetical protein